MPFIKTINRQQLKYTAKLWNKAPPQIVQSQIRTLLEFDSSDLADQKRGFAVERWQAQIGSVFLWLACLGCLQEEQYVVYVFRKPLNGGCSLLKCDIMRTPNKGKVHVSVCHSYNLKEFAQSGTFLHLHRTAVKYHNIEISELLGGCEKCWHLGFVFYYLKVS